MYNKLCLIFICLLFLSCSSNVRFIKTDDNYIENPKSPTEKLVIKENKISKPHRVIGVIEVELGKHASKQELIALMSKKAREIGADGVMMIDYDVDRNVYWDKHHKIVGKGRYRHHVVKRSKRVSVKKTATGLAVIFL